MSNSVLTSVFERSRSKGVARLVLLAIADRADDAGRAFPGTVELCRRCNASRDSVIEARKELQRLGELIIEEKGGSNGERRSHRYLISLAQPVGNPDRSENATGRILPATGRKSRLVPVGNSDPNPHKPTEPSLLSEIVEAWNSVENLPSVKALSPDRKRHLGARLKESVFRDNWRQAISRIAESVFCTGNGGDGWKANFDWFVRPGTVAKVMEGKYDNRTQSQSEKPKYSPIGEPLNDAARRIVASKSKFQL